FHDFSGWLIFMASFAILLLEMWALGRFFPNGWKAAANGLPDSHAHRTLAPSVGNPDVARSGPARSVVAILLLLATLIVVRTVDFREKIPLARPLGQVPMTIGEWSGVRSAMERDFLDTLKLSDYLLADYRNPQGKTVNAYVAYNESQRKGESSHSPDSCLPGSGWVFEDSGTVALPVRDAEGNPTVIRRAFIRKDGDRQLTYYWFPQRGRVLTNMFQLKAYAFWDALTRQRTDGALVRLITPVYGAEQPRDAEARLQRFAQEFVPVLAGFLPGKERR
ncbi:MAG TPA: EpsI family protein, partial [Candidatus Methylomirabilis sp.]